ncbi:MAG: DivIVA domain-containing protein [Clostridia bacterium]|nr:DivIVA domain-containing protein [Clostridia bacterium]
MNLPEEIRNKEFSTSFRGYNVNEVEDYIELLLEKYDVLYDEAAALANRLEQLNAQLESQSAASHRADDIIAAAKKEAATIVANAKNEIAAQSTGNFADLLKIESRIAAKKREYDELTKKVEDFKSTLFELYSAHITSLSSIGASKEGTITSAEKTAKTEGAEKSEHVEINAEIKSETENVRTPIEDTEKESAERTAVFDIAPRVESEAEADELKNLSQSTGIRITREPAGSPSETKSFSAVLDRLPKEDGETLRQNTKKHKKFL